MMSPSRGKSHLSVQKPTSYLQGLPTGQLKELVLKVSYPQTVEKPVSCLVTGTLLLQAYENR